MYRRFQAPSAPGRLVDIGGCRLHLVSSGSGGPPVVLDAAFAGSSISWTLIQPEIAKVAFTAAYDRAGMGWSEPAVSRRTLRECAGDLRALLAKAGIPSPRILCGHSYGGLTAQLYAALYPEEVAALVLVDTPDPEEWMSSQNRARLQAGARLCRRGAVAARLGVASAVSALASTGAIEIARRIARLWSGGGLHGQENQILAPMNKLPGHLRPVVRRFWTRPKFWSALAGQMEHLAESCEELAASPLPRDLPLTVLSAARVTASQLAYHKALVKGSAAGRHVQARHAGHWIPLDEPGAVVSAIRDEIGRAVRAGV